MLFFYNGSKNKATGDVVGKTGELIYNEQLRANGDEYGLLERSLSRRIISHGKQTAASWIGSHHRLTIK